MPRDQARTLHLGHHAANVQDTGAERADTRVRPVGAVSGRDQVQRRAGDVPGYHAGDVLPLHLAVQTPEDSVAAETAAEHLQFVHHRYCVPTVYCALRLYHLSGEGSHYLVAEVSRV